MTGDLVFERRRNRAASPPYSPPPLNKKKECHSERSEESKTKIQIDYFSSRKIRIKTVSGFVF
jgi:hypothetical protein